MIDLCICTYNPRRDLFKKVLASVAAQTASAGTFRVLIIDNASLPPLEHSALEQIQTKGIEARIVIESEPGIARARLRAIRETDAQLILFVDDDNELAPNYLSQGIAFALEHPEVGCFGGKLLLPMYLRPDNWALPFLPYLAIKDAGENPLFGDGPAWGVWEPPTAGAFIRRSVLNLFQARAEQDTALFKLGRVGKTGLASCEDSLIMQSAHEVGLRNAYNPQLVLYHHIDENRLKRVYLIRLMAGYGRSHVVLESLRASVINIPECYAKLSKFVRLLMDEARSGAKQSFTFAIGLAAYHCSKRSAYLKLRETKAPTA